MEKHWRCGGIHCLSSPEPMLNKNTNVQGLFHSTIALGHAGAKAD
jgi:hypothetical protein